MDKSAWVTIQPDTARFSAAIREASIRDALRPYAAKVSELAAELETLFIDIAKTTTLSNETIRRQLRAMAADNDTEAMLATIKLWRQGHPINYESVRAARRVMGAKAPQFGLVAIHPETIRRCAEMARS